MKDVSETGSLASVGPLAVLGPHHSRKNGGSFESGRDGSCRERCYRFGSPEKYEWGG